MKRYIDAEKFKHEWVDHFDSMYSEDCAKMFKKALNEAPIEDVAPIEHAHWIAEAGKHYNECSNCGFYKFQDLDADIWCDWNIPYCPHCGAKMDEEIDK